MKPEDLLRLDAIAEFAVKALALHETWELGHGRRSAELIENLALEMNIPIADIVLIKLLAKLHDIGKFGIPDVVLSRRKISIADKDMIRGHPFNGAELIKDFDFDERIYLGILEHHENWDGSGYPNGLKGLEISQWARMLSVIDRYDAIISERASHKARTMIGTLKIMEKLVGIEFDPEIFAAFKKMMSHG